MIAPSRGEQKGNIAFVPLAMAIMCGPGAFATTLRMISLVKHSEFEFISFLAILATMLVTYLCLAYADNILGRIGPMGINAVTRIVGFLVFAKGVGLYFPWGSKPRRTTALERHVTVWLFVHPVSS